MPRKLHSRSISENAITADHIATGAVTAADVADGSITAAKLAETYLTSTDVATYLTSNGYDTATNIVADLTDSAPATLDTLNELAGALGDDPNFATTVTNNIASKAPLASPTFTGNIVLNGNGSELQFTGGNNRVLFSGYRSLEGSTDGSVLQIGEQYLNTILYNDVGINTAGVSSLGGTLDVRFNTSSTHNRTLTKAANTDGLWIRNASNGSDFAGIHLATGDGTHFSSIVGARSDSAAGWGTHLGFYTHVAQTTALNTALERMRLTSEGELYFYDEDNSTSARIWTQDNESGMNYSGHAPTHIWMDNAWFRQATWGAERSWDDYPGITSTNDTREGPIGEFRIHGIHGVSGGDFSVVTRSDGGYVTGSDARRKRDIENITGALDIVQQLQGKKFAIINREGEYDPVKGNKKQFGLIAQECEDVIPEAITFDEAANTPNENGWASAYALDYASLTPLLIEAIKEQQTIIDDLNARIEALEG